VALRGPAQLAIREFLAAHRPLPGRSIRSRVLGSNPLGSGEHWYWAAVGQLEVMARMDRLGPEWCVVHGLPGPEGDDTPALASIEHLVIGPAGVFSVTIHDHTRQNVWVSRRAFVVDGHRVQHIRHAEAAVGHVERMLEEATGHHVRASTIIAVIDPGSLQVRDLPKDVFVVAADSIGSWLRARERVLDSAAVDALSAVARQDTTWPHVPVADSAVAVAARELAEFDQIRRQVTTARVVRAAWAIGAMALLTAALVAVGILQLVTSSSL
jgi:hypothetical protein